MGNSFDNQNFIRQLLCHFQIKGQVQNIAPVGDGHIHASYRVYNTAPNCPDYLLQCINTHVFPAVAQLQENITLVTTFLQQNYQKTPSTDFETLQLIPTLSNTSYYHAPNNTYWRVYIYKKHLQALTIVENTSQLFEIGRGYGQFLYDLKDFPVGQLHTTIAHFHSLAYRWQQFQAALLQDVCNRAKLCPQACAFVTSFYAKMSAIEQAEQQGQFPLRVTHNDTKCNNLLLDKMGKARCVIDLDTLMPGYLLYDFGDGLRTTMTTVPEDEADLQKIQLDWERIEAFAKGYLGSTASLLHPNEKHYLPQVVALLPFLIGLRFLTDFLAGDVYFKTNYPQHNLIRAKAQLHLSQLAMNEEEKLREIFENMLNFGNLTY